jgi:hypothetical protein
VPRTIAQGFDKLKSNVEITGLQESTVSTRQTTVRQAVEARMAVLESFLVGSYRRSTMVAPLSEADVDIFVIVDPKYYRPDGQIYLLDAVRASLKERYKTPAISRNGQAVTIRFDDFWVDVVPSFRRQGGGYLIPDSERHVWIETDPKQHIALWAAANKAHSGNVLPIMKMMKAWNKEHSEPLRSFPLEVLVLRSLEGVRIDDFFSGVRYVFDKARALVRAPNLDPAGFGGDVGAYLDSREAIDRVVSRLESGYARALEAESAERYNRTDQAYAKWRIVFGDYFPSYG